MTQVPGANELIHGYHVDGGAEVINVTHKNYGAKGDNSKLNGQAFLDAYSDALTKNLPLFVPPGRFLVDQQLPFENVHIYGVPERSFIVPTSSVPSPCVSFSSSDVFVDGGPLAAMMRGIIVDGSLTSGKVGLKLGESSLSVVSARLILDHVRAQYFTGTGGIGLQLADVVQPIIRKSRFTRNDSNLLVLATDPGLPTIGKFSGCYFNYATHKGVDIRRIFSLKFDHCVFESNGEEGIYCVPTTNNYITNLEIISGWFEGNCGSNTGLFHMLADASTSNTGVEPKVSNTYFAGIPGKAFKANGTATVLLDNNIYPQNQAGTVYIGSNVVGYIRNWNLNNGVMNTMVENHSPNFYGMYDSGLAVFGPTDQVKTVSHGLGAAPAQRNIYLIPNQDIGSARVFWATNMTSTTFDIALGSQPGGSGTAIVWRATLDG